ncbi:unnamed protein product [Trichogramma brassicae]|uniref:Uncharacterized protein n=1 Tax=Trichogramma brassicae TaxID=86971 RepID=A0A6H5HYS3_9HYME|nr:unnamed protein product [Trichogramma brassicae]
MSGLRPKRCNGAAGVRPLQLLVRPFGKRAGGGAGSVAVPLKSHTRPKESDRSADDALIRWLYRLNSKISSRFLRWERYLHIASGLGMILSSLCRVEAPYRNGVSGT